MLLGVPLSPAIIVVTFSVAFLTLLEVLVLHCL
jgi:hypothetical protein